MAEGSIVETCFPWTQLNIQFAHSLPQNSAEYFPGAKVVPLDFKSPENLSMP